MSMKLILPVNNTLSPFFTELTEEKKAICCFPAGFCNSSYGVYKFGSTAGGLR
jgi:hypothetical protein